MTLNKSGFSTLYALILVAIILSIDPERKGGYLYIYFSECSVFFQNLTPAIRNPLYYNFKLSTPVQYLCKLSAIKKHIWLNIRTIHISIFLLKFSKLAWHCHSRTNEDRELIRLFKRIPLIKRKLKSKCGLPSDMLMTEKKWKQSW